MTGLIGVPESLKSLNDLSTSGSALVRPHELPLKQQRDDHDKAARDHRRCDAWDVGLQVSAELARATIRVLVSQK